ncbi:hypothetical protein ASG30_20610 [Ramlibacter sp. Leaf400]|nr:hypothetical protein ASG30_20610 [Ramlibacter sp. Leaf400]
MSDVTVHLIKLSDGKTGYLVPWTLVGGDRCRECKCRSDPQACLPVPCELNSWGNPFRGQYTAIVVSHLPAAR